MTATMFGNFDAGTWVLVALAIVVGGYLWWMERREKKAKSGPCEQYAVLTEEVLATLPDDELVRAVAANLIAKQESDGVPLESLLPLLSPGRRGVYGVWLLCNELERRELGAYFRSPYRRFAPMAVEGFDMMGARACAAALSAACDRYERQKNGEKDLPSWEVLTAELRQALAEEQPLSLCVGYIRDNGAEFADQSAT